MARKTAVRKTAHTGIQLDEQFQVKTPRGDRRLQALFIPTAEAAAIAQGTEGVPDLAEVLNFERTERPAQPPPILQVVQTGPLQVPKVIEQLRGPGVPITELQKLQGKPVPMGTLHEANQRLITWFTSILKPSAPPSRWEEETVTLAEVQANLHLLIEEARR